VHLGMSLPFCCMAYTLVAGPDTSGCGCTSSGSIYAAALQLSHLITCIIKAGPHICVYVGLSPPLQVCMFTTMSLMPPTVLNPLSLC